MTEKDQPKHLSSKRPLSSEATNRREPPQSIQNSGGDNGDRISDDKTFPKPNEPWPLSHVGANLVIALGAHPLSISALSRATGFNRKAISNELETLAGSGWVKEIQNASGPQRIHALTPEGEQLREQLLEVLETCAGSESQ